VFGWTVVRTVGVGFSDAALSTRGLPGGGGYLAERRRAGLSRLVAGAELRAAPDARVFPEPRSAAFDAAAPACWWRR